MDQWWTYSLTDLVLFTAETYFRLFELYHRDWWPMQLVCIGLAAAILLCLWLKPAWGGRAITILLAASWAWVGWAFLHLRFTPVHWVADWYAVAFAIQALLLLTCGVLRCGVVFQTGSSLNTRVGIFMLLGALLAMPATAVMSGREWMQTELFAMTPDATALATLGLLLLVKRRIAAWLMVIPVAWCFISGATLWVLEAPEGVIPPAGALLSMALMLLPIGRRA